MPSIPVSAERFGGLNLRDDPQEVGLSGAVDLLDVDFGSIGRITQRPGLLTLGGTAVSSTGYQAAVPSGTNGGEYLLVRRSTTNTLLDRLASSASSFANIGTRATSATTVPLSFASLGTTSASFVYVSLYDSSGSGVTLGKYDGSTWGSGTGKPMFVATWPTSNRLVQGGYFAAADGPTGANGSKHTVFFSDPGAPDTYSANNFVTLRPGDGEQITAIVPWRELLFVFKQTAVFVFTGESVDSAGNPVFNYRRVDLPAVVPTAGTTYAPVAVPTASGVVFNANTSSQAGLYMTAGGEPSRLSDLVAQRLVATGPNAVSYTSNRLWVSIGGSQMLVFDFVTSQWTEWTLPSGGATTVLGTPAQATPSTGFPPSGVVGTVISGNGLAQYLTTQTTDNGSAINWSYTTGYSDVGGYFRGAQVKAAERKTLRETDIYGSGTVTHQVLALNSRPNDVADTGGSVTLGTAPVVARGKRRRACRGTYFAHKLSGSGAVTVSSLTHWIANVETDS